jgi:DNA-binding Lrp family transcriptional regulator
MAAKTPRRGMKAFVLIETAPGKTKSVKKELSRIAGHGGGLAHLDAVTGPYDFIAQIDAPNLDAIGRLVTDEIGVIDGVTRTTTCVAVSLG